jgi:CxxC-x17-CxxC domain-containing protein
MKKRTKSKSLSTAAAVDQDIVGLITTLVQKLTSLETKMDTLLSRTAPRPFEAPRQQPVPAPSTVQHRDTRPMYKAICADCNKECEVPFRPSVDRPVYCRECFTKRKNNGTFKPRGEGRPKEGPVAHVRPPEKPQAIEPAKPAGKKKPSAKKKKKKRS